MKKVCLVLLVAVVIVSIKAFGAERHDSAVFLIDVSGTVSSKDSVATARKISSDMNQRFPDYVMSAGAMVFGNLARPQQEWVAPVKDYDRAELDKALSGLKEGNGSTPLGFAIRTTDQGLARAQGKKALIIICDGLDNGVADPVEEVKILKGKYSSNLCVFTIQLGDSPLGEELLGDLVEAAGCGKANKASDLQSEGQVQALVDLIFPSGRAPRVEIIAKPRIGDQDGDGVPDDEDKCPNTPVGIEVNKAGCWVLKDLRFATGKAEILPQYTDELDRAVRVLKNNPEIEILIEGHTDSTGSYEINMALSRDRANSVLNYMVSKGIDKDRLTAKGFGSSSPVASNDTAEGRAQNRRVQLTVKK